MRRREFLQGLGAAVLGLLLPKGNARAACWPSSGAPSRRVLDNLGIYGGGQIEIVDTQPMTRWTEEARITQWPSFEDSWGDYLSLGPVPERSDI